MKSDQDDVFEFCLDQIEDDGADLNHNDDFGYPALPNIRLHSPSVLDDSAFEQFDDALIPIDEPISLGSLSRSSPTKAVRAPPTTEALAASLHLDGNKLRAMQSAFDQESAQSRKVQQPDWLDALPGHPDAPKSPQGVLISPEIDIHDEEWGGPAFSLPERHHLMDVVPRAVSSPLYNLSNPTLIGPKSSTFRAGFGPGLRFAIRGSTLTSVRILRINHDGVNPRLVDLHQKAVDRGDPLRDIAHAYQECPGDHWSLLIALFDPKYSSCQIDMHNALSNWLESAVKSSNQQLMTCEIQQHIVSKNRYIEGSDFWSEISASLLGHRLGDAVSICLRHGNVKLATLIAENGAGLRGQSRPLLREQIKKWIISGTWQTFTETCQNVYRILAGDVLDAGSDWLSNLAAKFWFSDQLNEPLQSLLAPFQSSSYDIRKSLLEFRADPSIPTARLFKGNIKRFDFALVWHMHDILSNYGVVLYRDAAWTLRVCYIAQLEAAHELKAALYLIIVGIRDYPAPAVSLLQDFLTRNWPKSGGSSFIPVDFGIVEPSESISNSDRGEFLSAREVGLIEFVTYWTAKVNVQDLYDPLRVIYTAKYRRCLSDGNISAAVTSAMRAGLWESAFSLFVTEIAPHLILTQNFQICNRFLSKFASKQACFPQMWNTVGVAFQALSCPETNDGSFEISLETEYLSNVKHGPKSDSSMKRLLLLENAIRRLARSRESQEVSLTNLL